MITMDYNAMDDMVVLWWLSDAKASNVTVVNMAMFEIKEKKDNHGNI